MIRRSFLRALLCIFALSLQVLAGTRAPAKLSDAPAQVLAETQIALQWDETTQRAWHFFRDKSSARTGLTQDRARNHGGDTFNVASMAATGYQLAAIPIAIERGWLPRKTGAAQAETVLRFVLQMPHEHGWLYHFVDKTNGQRAWNSEVSSLDTAIFCLGALACGEYFRATNPDIAQLADNFYARLDWKWMRTNGSAKPLKQVLAHGWTPENGFFGLRLRRVFRSDPVGFARFGRNEKRAERRKLDGSETRNAKFRGQRKFARRADFHSSNAARLVRFPRQTRCCGLELLDFPRKARCKFNNAFASHKATNSPLIAPVSGFERQRRAARLRRLRRARRPARRHRFADRRALFSHL